MRILLGLFAAFILSAAARGECLKEVFNRYCLGGPIAAVIEQSAPKHQFSSRGGEVFSFQDGSDLTMVTTYEGLIDSVARPYKPGSMLTFGKVRVQLVKLYGKPQRRSRLPDYARSTSDIETAIAIGRGMVVDRWQQEGWRVDLVWTTDKYIDLVYTHDEIYNKRRAANPNPDGL